MLDTPTIELVYRVFAIVATMHNFVTNFTLIYNLPKVQFLLDAVTQPEL